MQGFFVDTKRRAVVGPVYYKLRRPEGSGTGRQAKQATLYVNLLEVAAIRGKDRICGCFTCRMGSITPTLYFFVVNLNALTARFVRCADGVYSTDNLTARSEANAETRQVPFPFGVQRPQADQEQQAMRCAFKARREARMLEILRESWMEFANCPQRPTAAGFSETGRVPLTWGLATENVGAGYC